MPDKENFRYQLSEEDGVWTVSIMDGDGNHVVENQQFSRGDCLTWIEHHYSTAEPIDEV